MTETPTNCIDPYLGSFIHSLADANYQTATIKTYRNLLRMFGRHMDAHGIVPSTLTPALADELARMTPPGQPNMIRLHHLARRFAQHLLDIGVVPPLPVTDEEAARTALLADFELYMAKQRGLSSRTIGHALGFAKRFLHHCFGDELIEMRRVTAADITCFVQHVLVRRTPYRDKTIATHLRTFFRYLFARGVTATDLAPSVPKTAQRWNARLPRHLSSEGVEALLTSVRDNPRCGTRDYAILLLMARLGLRASEIVVMQLDDIDWRAGELIVRGKGHFHDRMPISSEVGEALSRYLGDRRSPAQCRSVFVAHRAPHRAFRNGQVVNEIIKTALKATGQKPVTPYVGSHVLRHSLATRLVNAGASLDEVSDVLRHRSRSSTLIYARLDIDGLRSIAQPWPVTGGVQ